MPTRQLDAALCAATLWILGACASAAPATEAMAVAEPSPAAPATPAPVAPLPADAGARVREARAACATEAAKQQLEVVDFVTFNRLDESNWDALIRARRGGKVVRVGCRHDLRAGTSYVYEPAAADGGNPWGPAGAPTPPRATPTPPAPVAAAPAPKPVPGSNIDLAAIPDSSARVAIVRTRDACLAEAARRKIVFDDFDAFRRVDARSWEAMLVIKKGKGSLRPCRLDLASGKATIR